ncbi:DUF2637 domain-containing protein [Streptomyces sp. SID5910]|uniref:DUF2637 domain-containing protein n=1 Tax=Streptomyces sp. SID5910 TaxID=2690312 RepID=UPI00136EF35A|nr:DUF2637 domain-containing protein [Streptomyces sp. SID5910]MYR46431.1 DUF2637 domain-containing protein [Streptomyces sp. SID5910]
MPLPDMSWDPAEELAFMLQDALEEQLPETPAPSPAPRDETPAAVPSPGSPLQNLQEITAELPPLRGAARSHRKVRVRRGPRGLQAVSYVIAAAITVIASAVSLFGGMVAYDPLRVVALTRLQTGAVSWWPLLVYGPWLASSLSVLRAALHQRRAVHSWCVVLAFSLIAMLLCVAAQTPRTLVDVAAAALPSLASLTCFQQLVRQITLTRPPRRASPRHRMRTSPPQGADAARAPEAAPDRAAGTTGARRDGTRSGDGHRPQAAPSQEPAPKTYVISDNRPLRNQAQRTTGSFPQPRRAGRQADSLSSRSR